MFSDFVLINRQGHEPLLSEAARIAAQISAQSGALPLLPILPLQEWFTWKTCLRQIFIGSTQDLHLPSEVSSGACALRTGLGLRDDDQVFVGAEAYRFLLEVACGLHSPLVGETEVFGQLRAQAAAHVYADSPWGVRLKRFFQLVFEDAKKVRQAHLLNLGSQSYGSVVRREIGACKEIHIIGAGQLAQEILPWVAKDGARVHIYCRNPEKAAAPLKKNHPSVEVHRLSEFESPVRRGGALVIAAPVTSEWIAQSLAQAARQDCAAFEVVVDLRGEAAQDPLNIPEKTVDLGELFSRISADREQLQIKKTEALLSIGRIAAERGRHIEYRPFGWEDVCA